MSRGEGNGELNQPSGHVRASFRLRHSSRWVHDSPSACCARTGGDEFALLLPGISNEDAEAVSNAIVHRDLAFRDIPTRMVIYDDSIEFINARRTNGFVPPASKAIRYGITQRLNPQIASVFSRPEYGTHLPEGGLPMLLRESHLFSGRRSEVYTTNDEFKLKLFGA